MIDKFSTSEYSKVLGKMNPQTSLKKLLSTPRNYLFTPAGDVHRVKYYEDTEFFIKWDGHWDMFFDEDLETAKSEIDKGSA